MKTPNYVIWTPGYFQGNSGGIIALFRLAHNLTLLGQKTYLIAVNKNPEWFGELTHTQVFDDNTVLIYPEIVCGNPLGAKHIVRWLLNSPGAVGGDGVYADSDLIFKYANYFNAPDENKVSGELRAFDLQLDFWQDLGYSRSGSCYLVRKGANKMLDKHSPDSTCIDNYPSNEYLREVFNQKQTFICYDSECFIATQAALCGCDVIVIPKNGISAQEWKSKFPYFQMGIKYGLEDVLQPTEKKQLRAHMESLEKESLELTKNFIRICQERVNA